jgi:hypothetical protein
MTLSTSMFEVGFSGLVCCLSVETFSHSATFYGCGTLNQPTSKKRVLFPPLLLLLLFLLLLLLHGRRPPRTAVDGA